MGKFKKRKNEKSELNKVKFKIGKKLPKNLNETKTDFKAKTLILKQQFENKTGPLSHRNLTLKELLKRLSFNDKSTRIDAITSLLSMLQSNTNDLVPELNQILESICALFTDPEYDVRKSCNEFLQSLFQIQTIDHKCYQSYLKLFNAHLSCAMTHINEGIQHNSLRLLDIFMQHLPLLIRTYSFNIFDNFIKQISKSTTRPTSGGGAGGSSSAMAQSLNPHKRILKNDPYKLTSTQSWRLRVLTRMQQLLAIILSNNMNNNGKTKASHKDPSYTTKLIKFDDLVTCQFKIYENNENRREQFRLSKRATNSTHLKTIDSSFNDINSVDIKDFFVNYVRTLGPLLIDCWKEAKPEDSNIIDSGESFDIMYCILSIMNTLIDNLNIDFMDIIASDYGKSSKKAIKIIENLFLFNFPYVLSENPSDKKSISASQSSIVSLNLLLCKFSLTPLIELNIDKNLSLLDYCFGLFNKTNIDQIKLNELQIVINLSKTIFNNYSSPELTKPFLVCLMNQFDQSATFSTAKWLLLDFLSQLCHDNYKLINDHLLVKFFAKVLKYCIIHEKEKKVDRLESLFNIIRKYLIKYNDKQCIKQHFQNEFINILNAMDFEDTEINDECKKRLLQFLFYLPQINNLLFLKLSNMIIKKKLSISNVNQVLGILDERIKRDDDNEVPVEKRAFKECDFIMFIMTLFNGYSGFELTSELSLTYKTNECMLYDESKLEFHILLCKLLRKFVSSRKNCGEILDILLSTSLPVLTKLNLLPWSTLYGTLTLIAETEKAKLLQYKDEANYVLSRSIECCCKQNISTTSDNYLKQILTLYNEICEKHNDSK